MAPAGEIELVRRLAAGDPAALEDANRLYGALCKAVAHKVLQDDRHAEDAVQEAFFALWQHRAGLVVRTAGVAPWLVVVTRNAALEALRSDARRAAREQRAADEPGLPDPSQIAVSSAEAATVRAAVRELPQEQRTVIELAYYRYRTFSQIAELTGAPLGTVKRRAQLALHRLSRALGSECR